MNRFETMYELRGNPKTKLLFNFVSLCLIHDVWAQEYCYTSGGVFGLIVLSVFTTLFVIALTFALFWFLWTRNLLKLDFILKTFQTKGRKSQKKSDLESGRVAEEDYAFDNPYFEDEEDLKTKPQTHSQTNTIISLQEKHINEEKTFDGINNKTNSQRILREKEKNLINNRFVKSLPLSAVFNNINILNKKLKPENVSLDDNYIKEKAERLEVELIGHDFTGLGFNICGNMRDGIFVKDVLHRGPANESKLVKAGDRIVSVCVSFESMVFEDAVAILSYASPYNVKIELQKGSHYPIVDRFTNTLNANKNLTSNTNKSLLHPLYRSQSVDDLTQITKDTSLSEKSTYSDGNNVIQRIKTQILNRINTKPSNIGQNISKNSESDLQVKEVSIEMPQIDANTNRADQIDSDADKHLDLKSDLKLEEKSDLKDTVTESQTVKKQVVPAKRKGRAPQPPCDVAPQTSSMDSLVSNNTPTVETIETTAQIHNEEISIEIPLENCGETDQTLSKKETNELEISESSSSNSRESINSDANITSKDVVLVPLESSSPQRVQSPTGKPKSSSLSDLTINNDKLQSALLERAVSLDMKGQSLPEENLNNIHTKHLLILNNESVESMPIMSWSLNKQLISDTNSSESTLDEINHSLTYNNKSFDSLDANKTESKDPSFNENEDKTRDLDVQNYVSHISVEVPPIISTLIKTNQNNISESIDSSLLNSSLSLSGVESSMSPELTLIDNNSESMSKNTDKEDNGKELVESNNNQTKEVIELSESELNHCMMSHKQFLQKKAKTNGSYTPVSPPTKNTILIEPPFESLDFESWSYVSEEENSNPNQTQSQSEDTLYRTALDMSANNSDSDNSLKTRKLPEVSGITLKTNQTTGESGHITDSNAIFISTNDSLDSSFTSSSSSPSK